VDALLRLSRAIDRLTESIGKLALWLILAMVAAGAWNAIGRHLGQAIGQNLSSNALIEAQWYLFSLVFLLSAGYVLKHDEHVRMDMFYNVLSPKRKAIADAIGGLLFLIPFSVLMLWFAWKPVTNSWRISEVSPDPGGLPRYPLKTMILVGFVLLIAQGISETIKNIAVITGHRTPPGLNTIAPHEPANSQNLASQTQPNQSNPPNQPNGDRES
jgi:TRAP-type mannitol/chloroaromatic compound transport system permease small subunit